MDIATLLIGSISGAVGGNAGGALDRLRNMGAAANTVIGAIGGLVGGYGLQSASVVEGTGMVSYMIGAVLGGLGLTLLIGYFKG